MVWCCVGFHTRLLGHKHASRRQLSTSLVREKIDSAQIATHRESYNQAPPPAAQHATLGRDISPTLRSGDQFQKRIGGKPIEKTGHNHSLKEPTMNRVARGKQYEQWVGK
ncbi:hypothetical protein GUJ93_ZPchr0004g39505 [Zizania palustris]|uniref:Uncharacterized protein n=1 Tax=Zizania palustris TaxID=103762 RepID=A0A8J5SK15_ZIZPA|nr:hypothetical protein GUJ93_ZPchr0004g39505 [Zizania palustris]